MKKSDYDIEGVLREMRREYWQGLEEGNDLEAAETEEFLLFRLGGQSFAIPTRLAREVLRVPRVVLVPRVDKAILGIVNLRGQVLAVTDLCPLLGLTREKELESGRLIVAHAAGITTALAVEEVAGIRQFPVDSIEPLPQGEGGLPRHAASGQIGLEQGMLVLLDLEQLLCREEFLIDQKEA